MESIFDTRGAIFEPSMPMPLLPKPSISSRNFARLDGFCSSNERSLSRCRIDFASIVPVCRATNARAHSASFQSVEKIAPPKPGIKHFRARARHRLAVARLLRSRCPQQDFGANHSALKPPTCAVALIRTNIFIEFQTKVPIRRDMSFGVRATTDRTSSKSVPAGSSALIVDNSETMRIILRDMLMRIGVRTIDDASGVAGAIARLQTRSYSVIISDWHMEPLDGLELLREVKRISRPGQNRFIFSTSERSWGTKASAKLEGAEAFLIKPFTIDTLKTTIADLLS